MEDSEAGLFYALDSTQAMRINVRDCCYLPQQDHPGRLINSTRSRGTIWTTDCGAPLPSSPFREISLKKRCRDLAGPVSGRYS